MDNFSLFFRMGLDHILSPEALDHQLFLLALVAGFSIKDLRPLLILVTAFTIGHSLTLALCSSGQIRISSYTIELLIPFTILISGVSVLVRPAVSQKKLAWMYPSAGIFGLIHGMGFANTLKAMLGREESLLLPLFGFNLGLELGQLVVILVWFSLFGLLALWYKNYALMGRICGLLAIVGALWMMAGRI
jgi:hypothetical protein